MKLYTEEQVRNMLRATCAYTPTQIDSLIETITPIELPSDEDIDDELAIGWSDYQNGQNNGAKWMRDLIQGGKQ